MTEKAKKLGNMPAFPTLYLSENGLSSGCPFESDTDPGLTKREYFASLAMQGCLSKGMGEVYMASMCVKYADALLEALSCEN